MTRYFFLFVLLLTLAGVGAYTWLGGFREPAVRLETTAAPVYLAGQPFAGRAGDEQFGALFRQAKEMQDAGRLRGDLANLYYNNPESARDTVRAFVGLAVADTSQPLPAGFRYRVVRAGQRVVAARLRGTSYLLSPGKLYPAAEQALRDQKLQPRPFYLERFSPDDAAELWVGVQ